MYDKFIGSIVALPVMVACCVGVPLLVGWITGAGLFAWFADNAFAAIGLFSIAAVVYLVHRDRKRRRHLGAQRERAVELPMVEDLERSTHRRGRSPVK